MSEKQYLDLVEEILENGHDTDDRTGVGTKSLFARTMRFDLQEGFPLITTRKMYFTGIVDELIWMLSGSTDIYDLPERSRQIWDQDEWVVDGQGGLGPSYGKQFRSLENPYKSYISFDQVEYVIDNIKENPNSRRHVISLWNQPYMDRTNLPCCHGTKIQFNVRYQTELAEQDNDTFSKEVGYLDCHMDARSQDVMIGMPWNIAFYSLFTHMVAQVTGYRPGEYIHTGGDCHIYKNHIEKAKQQVQRKPKPKPEISLNSDIDNIDDFGYDDIELNFYDYHPKISYPIAV